MTLDPQLVDRVVAEATKRTENLDYFFDRLESPEWIEPLRERGFWANPPEQVIDDEGYVRAPGWSQSRYLARVAAAAPSEVIDTIRSIRTDNERVHEDFEDAALVMPAAEAREVADLEAEWLSTRDRIYYSLPWKTVGLIEKLAADGEIEAAFRLFRVMFEALPDVAGPAEWRLPHARSRFSDWEYDHLLAEAAMKLLAAAPSETVRTLGDLLNGALVFLAADGEGVPDRLWRTRISSDQHRALNVEDSLLSALRDVARRIREAAALSDAELADLLGAYSSDVFARVLTDALTQPPDPDPAIAGALMMDTEELAEHEPSPEYRELLQTRAALLSAEHLQQLLAVIDAGPDVDRFRELAEKYGDRTPSAEDTRAFVRRWQAGRLRLLVDVLPPDWLQRCEELVAEFGDVDIPLSGEARTFVGPTSPASVEELAAMTDDALVAYLRDWEPEQSWDAPSTEGLARSFGAFVEAHPERFAQITASLRDVKPAYVQWALHGLEQALRHGRSFRWAAVLDLLVWIAEQPRARPGGRGDDYADLDPGWVWTRKAIASLVEAGLQTDSETALPFEERERVWSVVSAIADDPDPTQDDEERYGGHNMDPLTLALNTTRPRAMAAAIAYAVWAFRRLHTSDADRDAAAGHFFAEAPEVPELLNAHLDPERDTSLSVRSVYGQHFANLFALDHEWAQASAASVFPEEDTGLREAAWGAFVIYNGPYNNLLPVLREQYVRSAELAGSTADRFRWMNGDPRVKVGEHAAMFYLRGVIELDDELLETFWRAAPPETKASVVDAMGRTARDAPDLADTIAGRLVAIWEQLIDADEPRVRAAFAWWLAARKLPADWRLRQLEGLLDDGVRPEPAFLVTEELAQLALAEPLRTVQALRQLLEMEREGWAIGAWRDDIVLILRTALDSSDEEARRRAEETIHWLGALGHRDFGMLLEPRPRE
jgi:hypothetical protein